MSFAAIVLISVFALLAASFVLERLICKDRKDFLSTHYIAYTAMFSCMAAVLMLIEIPLFFAPSFYKLDLSEVPILICTFYLGPVSGFICELMKQLLFLMLHGSTSAFVGEFANFCIGICMILPASFIYHCKPGKKTAIIGIVAGTLFMTVFGSVFNAKYLIPQFSKLYNIPVDAIISMGSAVNSRITDVTSLVLFAVVPFNLLKGTVDSVITFALYKRISPLLHKGDEKRLSAKNKKENLNK